MLLREGIAAAYVPTLLLLFLPRVQAPQVSFNKEKYMQCQRNI
jgi:hypothetical protein